MAAESSIFFEMHQVKVQSGLTMKGGQIHDRLFILFLLSGELGLLPFLPTALQSVDPGISFIHELKCHTGTGGLLCSGTVKDKRFVFGIFVHP